MWACAVTLYQLTFSKLPFDASGRIELYRKINNEEPNYSKENLTIKDCPNFN